MNQSLNKIRSRLKFLKFSDLKHILLFFLALPISFFFKRKHKNLWVIAEDGTSARDNGYWLFLYILENCPEIEAVYVISKNSPDFNKVKNIGKVIEYESFLHWVYYLSAQRNIFSSKVGKPSSAVCFPLEQFGLLHTVTCFISHGVKKDSMPSLFYDVTHFSLFTVTVEREKVYVEENYGYKNKGAVKLLGLCRYDNLMNYKKIYKKNQILLMPTWRQYLKQPSIHSGADNFIKSEYFKTYQSLIKNENLISFLQEKNLQLVFYPHKCMQNFINCFESYSSCITIADWRKYDVQTLLMESALCITDYSSIFMDFAYMEKPVLFYQFDYEEFRKEHYAEGYFSYEDDGFGEICTTEDDLIKMIFYYSKRNFEMKEMYKKRVTNFFTFHDNKNCERTVRAIKEIKNDKKLKK